MKLPKQSAAVQRQISVQPALAAVESTGLFDGLIDGVFGLGSLVCEAFSGKEREDCLRGYNMVATPGKQILGGLGGLLL